MKFSHFFRRRHQLKHNPNKKSSWPWAVNSFDFIKPSIQNFGYCLLSIETQFKKKHPSMSLLLNALRLYLCTKFLSLTFLNWTYQFKCRHFYSAMGRRCYELKKLQIVMACNKLSMSLPYLWLAQKVEADIHYQQQQNLQHILKKQKRAEEF